MTQIQLSDFSDDSVSLSSKCSSSYEIERIKQTVDMLTKKIHLEARKNGWWDGLPDKTELPFSVERVKKINIGEKMALIHSEISEALEAARQPNIIPDEHLPRFPAILMELGDAVTRCIDLAEALGCDETLTDAIIEKIKFNQTRGKKHGGKLF